MRCPLMMPWRYISKQGKLVFTILAGLAEFESALISERVTAGMERARAQGTSTSAALRSILRRLSKCESSVARDAPTLISRRRAVGSEARLS